jgi:hypothetical protein
MSFFLLGAPPPSVTWFREGKVLKDDGRTDIYHDGARHYLAVTKAFIRDAGEYTCTANNAVGAVFCSVYVTVEGKATGWCTLVPQLAARRRQVRYLPPFSVPDIGSHLSR